MPLPVGKLPPYLLKRLLAAAPVADDDVLLGPGIGLDCAVVRHGDGLLVFKSDPITFASDELGWYLVQVNANDVATTGARPRWLLVTMLLPEGDSDEALVETLASQIYRACRELTIAVIGGHTEITHGLSRPIAVGTLVGEVSEERLVTPQGATPGDALLLTKGVPIEGTAILAREFPERVSQVLSPEELRVAANFLYEPGISVVADAQTALAAGQVTAMHDPTEGGLAAALWELAEASGCALVVERAAVPVPPLSQRICEELGLDPLATIASGALLLTTRATDAPRVNAALQEKGIASAIIGKVAPGPPAVCFADGGRHEPLSRPDRDELARFYEEQ
ncbi:MAG TPA: AIR synthase family protein [Candidatus Sulfomarinibacteraceae bacterium]|nr:AIR synthase family protein [Candidatus Sulfomarinibacteraceae bacterium]